MVLTTNQIGGIILGGAVLYFVYIVIIWEYMLEGHFSSWKAVVLFVLPVFILSLFFIFS